MVVGATENAWGVVSGIATLGYYLVTEPVATVSAVGGVLWNMVWHPVNTIGKIGSDYGHEVTDRYGDGTSAFNRGRAVGYVGFDIGLTILTAGGVSAAKNALKAGEIALKPALKEVAKEAAEKAVKEAAEKIAKEAAEKVAKEAAEKAAKEAAEKAAKEAAEKAAKEAAEKAAKEAAEKAAKQVAKTAAEILTKAEIQEVIVSWYRSTFETIEKSIIYHFQEHVIKKGLTMSLKQYTEDALLTFKNHVLEGIAGPLRDGTPGILIQRPGLPGGWFTKAGKIVSFWYK